MEPDLHVTVESTDKPYRDDDYTSKIEAVHGDWSESCLAGKEASIFGYVGHNARHYERTGQGVRRDTPPTGDSWSYLLTGCDCLDKTRLSDFEGREGQSSRFFVLASRYDDIVIFVCPASPTYVLPNK